MSNRIIRNLPDSKYKAVVGNTLAGGVWNGISLPTGVGVPWEEVGNRDTYAAIDYDATGTTFLIEYTM